ncbi:hypothetical protein AAFF_G00431320 [Aldrovandia affinis]|uniref:Retinitis pigmentosa 1-like 1 protein n=1 Tax=Aldrovandia affinis TaxID=143900 RepID=A0AAD7WIM6_9TELE|nr:hypothetical protein AAFF_G00431320 [Aldrovandia affinis]
MYEVVDDFDEHCEEMDPQKEREDSSNGVDEGKQVTEGEQGQHKEAEIAEEEKEANTGEPELPDAADVPPSPDSKCPKRECVFPRGCHSSVQVMKILLSSKLDRSNSLPEVSPVYGRKLSSSAKGLLDCLTKLQLLGSGPTYVKPKTTKCQELMDILQTLWLSDPSDCEQMRQKDKLKDHGAVDNEYNPRSSSGVDVSGSSGSSGKSLGTVDQKVEVGHGRFTPVIEQDLQEETELQEEEESSKQPPEELSDMATPDITSQVQDSPGNEDIDTDKESQDREEGSASDRIISSNKIPKNVIEKSSSNKNSGNNRNAVKSAKEMEMDLQDTSSETPPSVQGAELTKKASQDPDPIWVFNLLKKLEKQFMTHYLTAMSELKVRWNLDESVMLDAMINELRDEVHKRIQSSISQELKKIQSRAGREPRPPTQAISRESTLQTEQRRRRLKVMHNKTISRREDNFTATVTNYSDQRSDDEYCPCDTCMKKKMAAKFVTPKFVNPPPLIKDFDLRKILQKKPLMPEQMDQPAATVDRNQGDSSNLGIEQANEMEEQACNAEQPMRKDRGDEDIGEQGEIEEEGRAEDDEAVENGEAVEEGEEEKEGEAEDEGEAAEEGNEAKDDIAPESEAEDTVDIEGGTGEGQTEGQTAEGETDAGEGKETAEEGDGVEDSKEDEEAKDKGDGEGSTKSHDSKDEADNGEGKQESINENEEAGNQAEDKSGNTDTETAEEKSVVRETEEEDDVEADMEHSEADTHDEQSGEEIEGEHQDEEQSETSTAEKIQEEHRGEESPEQDENERSGESEDAVEEFTAGESKEQETDGASKVNLGGDEDEELENKLMRHMTRSSIESRQGSLDDSMDFESVKGTYDTKSYHGSFRATSNHMYPNSSEEDAKGTGHSSTEEHKMAVVTPPKKSTKSTKSRQPKKSDID